MNRKMTVILFVLMVSLIWAGAGFAGEGTAGDYVGGMGRNLGRGLWNIVSSPAEIPCTMSKDMSTNAGTGFFTGLGKGLGLMVRRMVVGVSEIATFVMPAEATIPPVCKASK